eukprot:TRINITY_DN545_c0_g1_i8.p1 TRINITY_DN545_c0_g1~~TRINITY_DN545_c0_g1_i8.p1  ORF type:complete len:417 (+),score=64.89 TRINITY_DN545_c0_g1_i8:1274-2524(+)
MKLRVSDASAEGMDGVGHTVSASCGGGGSAVEGETFMGGIKALLREEKSKVVLSAIGVVVCRQGGMAVKKALLVDHGYGEYLDPFPAYTDFLGFCYALGAVLVALLHFAYRKKCFFPPAGPLCAYVGIACCATLAIASEGQVDQRLHKGVGLAWKSLAVPAVMVWQTTVLRAKFSLQDWMLSALFTLASILAAVPWHTGQAVHVALWRTVEVEGVFLSTVTVLLFILLYVAGDSLSQTYQERLFREKNMIVSDQVLYIFFFMGVIQVIGWLVGKHLSVVVGFIVDHPQIIGSLVIVAIPVVARVYLMSYMLRLCGALICAMIHQVVMELAVVVDVGLLYSADNPPRWFGTLVMVVTLVYVMFSMPHNHPNGAVPLEKELHEGPLSVRLVHPLAASSSHTDLREIEKESLLPMKMEP